MYFFLQPISDPLTSSNETLWVIIGILIGILGQEVFRLEVSGQKLGKYQIRWDGKNKRGNDLSSGLYIYRFFAGNSVQTKKMILLK